jgi:hypothetical protein
MKGKFWAVTALVLFASLAYADTFTLAIKGTGKNAVTTNLTLTGTPITGMSGYYSVTGVSGTFTDPDTGKVTLTTGTIVPTGLKPGSVADNGLFLYDNLLNLNPGSQPLDMDGILIQNGKYELNLFEEGNQFYWSDNGNDHSNNAISDTGSVTRIASTPEPGSLFLLGSGLFVTAGFVFRKKPEYIAF